MSNNSIKSMIISIMILGLFAFSKLNRDVLSDKENVVITIIMAILCVFNIKNTYKRYKDEK